MKRALEKVTGPSCPCCVERLSFIGSRRFKPRLAPAEASEILCSICIDVQDWDAPPFLWPTSVEEIQASAAEVLRAAETNLAAVAAADPPTRASVLLPLMCPPNYKTNPLVCQSKFLQHGSADPAIREAAEAAGKLFAPFKSASRTRADVLAKVKAFAATPEAAALSSHEAHFVEALLKDFERGGLALGCEQQAELQRLLDADSAICKKFGSNLGNDKTKLFFTEDELRGMAPSWVSDRKGEDGRIAVTLRYPDVLPLMSQCEVESTRKKMTEARESAYENNLELMAEGVQLRKQTAMLLGYKSWSHYVIETRMAGTPETVTEFLEKIRNLAKGGAAADLETLRKAKASHLDAAGKLPEGGLSSVALEAWDSSFYHQYILKRDYGVDEEAVSEYFPLDHVVATTLQLYQELLSLQFMELPAGAFSRWHEEVRCFIVHDAPSFGTGGARVGHFYLDLHPREGKYPHAAIFHLLKRSGAQTAVDCMMCNLPAASKDGKPALLRHDDVVTFFHEFGHIMHGLCAEGDGNSTHLAKCPRDFVEAPSQMLENWCWQPSVLKRLSKHHESGESLPDSIRGALVAAKNVHESVGMCRQVYLATLDLVIHSVDPPNDVAGLQELVDRLRPEITGIRNPPGANFLRSFGHLMNQYSAAYYGYMWAEVISADMFATMFEGDCMSVAAGTAYRKKVLAPGGTGKIMAHLKSFLGGRAPEQEPFLRSRGILK